MSFVLLDVVSSLSRFAGALFCDAFIFPLLLLPSAVSLVCFVLRLAFVRLRKFSVRWVFYLSAVSLLFYAAVASLSGKAVGVLAFIGFFAAACDLVCASFLFLPFPRRKRKACKKKKAEELARSVRESEEPVIIPSLPPKIDCFGENDRVVVEKDVRLGHVRSALNRLRGLQLGASDRLEAEKMSDLLSVYEAKGTLCGKEADALNDVLSCTLKMMAKYDA